MITQMQQQTQIQTQSQQGKPVIKVGASACSSIDVMIGGKSVLRLGYIFFHGNRCFHRLDVCIDR
jgi:hypothetical protein